MEEKSVVELPDSSYRMYYVVPRNLAPSKPRGGTHNPQSLDPADKRRKQACPRIPILQLRISVDADRLQNVVFAFSFPQAYYCKLPIANLFSQKQPAYQYSCHPKLLKMAPGATNNPQGNAPISHEMESEHFSPYRSDGKLVSEAHLG
jgi:hypothetical protein